MASDPAEPAAPLPSPEAGVASSAAPQVAAQAEVSRAEALERSAGVLGPSRAVACALARRFARDGGVSISGARASLAAGALTRTGEAYAHAAAAVAAALGTSASASVASGATARFRAVPQSSLPWRAAAPATDAQLLPEAARAGAAMALSRALASVLCTGRPLPRRGGPRAHLDLARGGALTKGVEPATAEGRPAGSSSEALSPTPQPQRSSRGPKRQQNVQWPPPVLPPASLISLMSSPLAAASTTAAAAAVVAIMSEPPALTPLASTETFALLPDGVPSAAPAAVPEAASEAALVGSFFAVFEAPTAAAPAAASTVVVPPRAASTMALAEAPSEVSFEVAATFAPEFEGFVSEDADSSRRLRTTLFHFQRKPVFLEQLLIVLALAFASGVLAGMACLLVCWNPGMRSFKGCVRGWRRWKLHCIMVPDLCRVLIEPWQLPDEECVCVVCLVNLREEMLESNGLLILPCGHIFHYDCLHRWLEQRLACPSCTRRVANLGTSFHAVLSRDARSSPSHRSRTYTRRRPKRIACDHPVAYECLERGKCVRASSACTSPLGCERGSGSDVRPSPCLGVEAEAAPGAPAAAWEAWAPADCRGSSSLHVGSFVHAGSRSRGSAMRRSGSTGSVRVHVRPAWEPSPASSPGPSREASAASLEASAVTSGDASPNANEEPEPGAILDVEEDEDW